MSSDRALLVVLLALPILTVGCISTGGSSDASPTDEADDSGAPGSLESSATANGSAAHPHEPVPTRRWDNRTGSLPGPNVILFSMQGTNETFRTDENTTRLSFILSSSNGELWADVYPPGCSSSGMGAPSCAESLDTCTGTGCAAGGDAEASWSTEDPEPGLWEVTLFKGDPGATATSYTLTTSYLQLELPSPDHHG